MEQTEKLLTNAAEEIKHLRAANREMGIRLEMFDHCMMLLNAAPQRQAEEKAAIEKISNQLKANRNE